MSRNQTTRRAMLAGAAVASVAMPALSVAVAETGDHELLTLGPTLDRLETDWLAQSLVEAGETAIWEAACIKAGLPRIKIDYDAPAHEKEEYHARCDARAKISDQLPERNGEVDEHGCSIFWNEYLDRMSPLVNEILSHDATTLAGMILQTRASMLDNSSWWTAPRFEGTDQDRAFFESLCSFLKIKPVVLAFVESPEYQAAYPNRLDSDED